MPLEDHPTDPDKYVYKSRQYQIDCPTCEYHKQRAQIWRDEAYRLAGHPLPRKVTSMTQDEIIEMARQAGLHIATDVNWMPIIGLEYAERFAKLVAEKEREACAKEADKRLHDYTMLLSNPPQNGAAWSIASAIRARGQV